LPALLPRGQLATVALSAVACLARFVLAAEPLPLGGLPLQLWRLCRFILAACRFIYGGFAASSRSIGGIAALGVRMARQALEETSCDPWKHAAVSKSQASSLRAAIAGTRLGVHDVSAIVLEITKLKWAHQAHMSYAMGTLQMDQPTSATRMARRENQDWSAVISYFTKNVWDILLDKSMSSNTKMNVMIEFCIRGGLRLPTEATSKLLCSLWVLKSEDNAKLLTIDQKLVYLKHWKMAFRAAVRRSDNPIIFMQVLPAIPCEVMAKHRALWDAWFIDGSLPSEIPAGLLRELQDIDTSYTCRGRKSLPGAASHPSTTVASEMPSLLQVVLDAQRHMMAWMRPQEPHLILNGNGGGHKPACFQPVLQSGHALPVRPLELSEQPPRRAVTFAETQHDSGPQAAGSSLLALPPLPPPPQGPALVAAPAADMDSAAVEEPRAADDGALDAVNALLNAMGTRKAAKAKAAAVDRPAAKRAKSAAQPAETSAPAAAAKLPAAKRDVQAEPAKTGAPDQAKQPKKKKNTNPAAKKQQEPKLIGDKVSGIGGESGKAFGGKASGKGDKVYTYGCSKCRWRRGCAVCLNPDFKGARFSYLA
jgi:hypothetical protein